MLCAVELRVIAKTFSGIQPVLRHEFCRVALQFRIAPDLLAMRTHSLDESALPLGKQYEDGIHHAVASLTSTTTRRAIQTPISAASARGPANCALEIAGCRSGHFQERGRIR
jgi:hypothetical protein